MGRDVIYLFVSISFTHVFRVSHTFFRFLGILTIKVRVKNIFISREDSMSCKFA